MGLTIQIAFCNSSTDIRKPQMIDFSLNQPMIDDGLSLLKTLSGRIEPAHEVFDHPEAPRKGKQTLPKN